MPSKINNQLDFVSSNYGNISDSTTSDVCNNIRIESLHGNTWSYDINNKCCNKIHHVIHEILESEYIYVNDLQEIITGYLDEWQDNYACPLTNEQLNYLFNNIREIYNFNRHFLQELEQCNFNPVEIAHCFLKNSENFSVYVFYCLHYPKSVNILTELMRSEKTAYILRERQVHLRHALPLGSYLLKPVQRILKYHLLLRNMVKYKSTDESDYVDITAALSVMTRIAHHINTTKRCHEQANRVKEIQSLLSGWQGPDLSTFGELYAECTFQISDVKISYRHVFLFERLLLLTKKSDSSTTLNYKLHILCSNLMLIECIPNEPLSFQIIPFDNPKSQFTIHARTLEEKRHWTHIIKKVILENYNVHIPSNARKLVMELGHYRNVYDDTARKLTPMSKCAYFIPYYFRIKHAKKENLKSRLIPLLKKLYLTRSNVCHEFQKSAKRNNICFRFYPNENKMYSNNVQLKKYVTTKNTIHQNNEVKSTLTGNFPESVCKIPVEDNSLVCMQNIINLNNEEANSYLTETKESIIEEIINQLSVVCKHFQKVIENYSKVFKNTNEKKRSISKINKNNKLQKAKDICLIISDLNDSNNCYSSICKQYNNANMILTQTYEYVLPNKTNQISATRKIQLNSRKEYSRKNNEWWIQSNYTESIYFGELLLHENFYSLLPWNKNKNIMLCIRSKGISESRIYFKCKFYWLSFIKIIVHKMLLTIYKMLLFAYKKPERLHELDKFIFNINEFLSKIENNLNTRTKNILTKFDNVELGARIRNYSLMSNYVDLNVISFIGTHLKNKNIQNFFSCPYNERVKNSSIENISNILFCESNEKYYLFEQSFNKSKIKFNNIFELLNNLNLSQSAKDREVIESFRKYSQITVNISVYKLIKIPPWIPIKQFISQSQPNVNSTINNFQVTSNATNFISPFSRGWVKHVVSKFQSELETHNHNELNFKYYSLKKKVISIKS